ncbi:MAG: DUF1080 domain-containing protein [Pirellulales bacterium]|nr:DUF1080 domain-containing protein [Pirellulales bacterium]
MSAAKTLVLGMMLMIVPPCLTGLFSPLGWAPSAATAAEPEWVVLFNGKDLQGWRGQGMVNPLEWQAMDPAQRAAAQKSANADKMQHWKVENDEIVNDGHGVYLTTEKDYGDFELELEWKMMAAGGDSGIYLRGYPQVQIWDPGNANERTNGADKGSGALWNNSDVQNGKFPLVKADNPIGEWNTMRIKMTGEHVTVYLNDKLVVDNATMDNYYERGKPLAKTGPIQLQTHGSEMRFRNIRIRELK